MADQDGGKIKLKAVAGAWGSRMEFLVMQGDAVGTNVTLEYKQPGFVVEPTFRLGNEEAQDLLNDLWNAGFRPNCGTGNAGQLQATEKHLDDMRKIAFSNLDIEE